jgi:hypothetical protein
MDVKTAIGAAAAVSSLAAVIVATPATAGAEEVDRCQGTIGRNINELQASRPNQQIQAVYPGEVTTALYIKGRITVQLTEAGYVWSCRNG